MPCYCYTTPYWVKCKIPGSHWPVQEDVNEILSYTDSKVCICRKWHTTNFGEKTILHLTITFQLHVILGLLSRIAVFLLYSELILSIVKQTNKLVDCEVQLNASEAWHICNTSRNITAVCEQINADLEDYINYWQSALGCTRTKLGSRQIIPCTTLWSYWYWSGSVDDALIIKRPPKK